MWLISHLVSEHFGAEFEHQIQGILFFVLIGKWACEMALFGLLRLTMIWIETGVCLKQGMDEAVLL